MNQTFIGKVENGKFRVLWPSPAAAGEIRLTTIAMNQSVPPETHELDLGEYEGKAIAVQGHDGGGWIYSAQMIDEAGPIVTVMVQQVFGQ